MRATANSSAQAEYMSMAVCTREGIWLRRLMSDMGYGDLSCTTYGRHMEGDYRRVRMKDDDPFGDAYPVAGDNKAALQMARNPVHHKKGKHIHIAWNLTREEVYKGSLAPVHISTTENPADLMTKPLKKTLHRKHASFMVAEFHNGEVKGLDGKRLELCPVEVHRRRLYEVTPAGLGKPSDVADKIDRVCTFDFKDGLDETPKPCVTQVKAARAAAAVSGAKPESTGMGALQLKISAAVGQLLQRLAAWFHARLTVLLAKRTDAEALVSERLRDALQDAILDSGASATYVTSRVALANAKPGVGYVRSATGRREAITERGNLGPLAGAQKVEGFARTLVSVMDVAEQVGDVRFTTDAAFVESNVGDRIVASKIANATETRLYDFDMDALERHVQMVRGRDIEAAGA